ncbi:glycine cleavage system protein GcvH [candidate division WOR-3 bacterium]|nr:glycine cleavage system protein GcvH [candidate division WOR-3 bacterium]
MAEVREGLKYTETEEWVKIENDIAMIGITDHAQEELSDIVAVEIKEIGTRIKREESIATVDAVKAASDIYSPLSGEITEVNQNVVSSPELINHSPYDQGWLLKLKIENPNEISSLLGKEQYDERHE